MTTETFIEPTATTDVGSEQVVLGCIILDETVMDDVIDVLHVDDFFEAGHQAIYLVLMRRYTTAQPLGPQSILEELLDNGRFIALGGANYLHQLTQRAASATSAMFYAQAVQAKAQRRKLLALSNTVADFVRNQELTVDDIVGRTAARLDAVQGVEDNASKHVTDIVTQLIADLDKPRDQRRCKFGLADLDALVGPIRPGHLITFAGRPGMGKTVSLIQAARRNGLHDGKSVLSFSLEMQDGEWVKRVVSAETGVNWEDLESGRVSEEGLLRVKQFNSNFGTSTYRIVSKSTMTVAQIVAQAKKHKRQHGQLDLVTIDYLQLVQAVKGYNRQEEIADIMRNLKIAAVDLEAAVIIAAQLNRGPEARADKRPMLSDLRESGAIEQDSDVVVMAYRPDYYDPMESPGEVEFIVAKNRHGETGTVHAQSQLRYSRFRNLTNQLSVV